jgi:hypothetical protein
MVTILFSAIVGFTDFCKSAMPLEIVQLLNDVYTSFDVLLDPRINDVYKVNDIIWNVIVIRLYHRNQITHVVRTMGFISIKY